MSPLRGPVETRNDSSNRPERTVTLGRPELGVRFYRPPPGGGLVILTGMPAPPVYVQVMRARKFSRAIGIAAIGALLLGAECMNEVSPPPKRALYPSGQIQRGPFYSVLLNTGTDYNAKVMVADSVTIAPKDDVVYDPLKTQFQFRALGTYTVTLNSDPSLSSQFTVVDAPTIVYDMDVNGNRDIYSQTIYGFNFTRLTTHSADDDSPTVARGVMVFVSNRDGNKELYRKALDGSGSESRMTFTSYDETQPALSPDGLKLVFVKADSAFRRLMLITSNGAGYLTNASADVEEGWPSWYLSSDYLLFSSKYPAVATGIYRASITLGSAPLAFAVPKAADSVYDQPSVQAMTSANFAVGAMTWIASKPGGPMHAHMGPVYYNGLNLAFDYGSPSGSYSIGEPSNIGESIVFTRFMADGSTTLGWIVMTAPFPSFDFLWHAISVPGKNPRRATLLR